MSEIAPAQRRPLQVTAAGYLLFAVAVLALVVAVLPLPYASDVSAAAKRAYAGLPNGSTTASIISATTYVTAVIYVLAAAGLVVLGVFDLRGSNGARIATWIVGGLGVLCCGGGVASRGLTANLGQGSNAEQMRAAAKEVQKAYPSWFTGVQTALTILAVLALILVIIFITLPASNAYFRRGKAPLADPGLPPLAYPQVPPYPQAPQAPQTPPAPQAPQTPPAPPPSQEDR